MAKLRTSLENYTLLVKELEQMRNTKFRPRTFLRKIRPFCKTSHIRYQILFIRIRGASTGITIHVQEDYLMVQVMPYVHEYTFYTKSHKEFISKLFKHNLLTP